MMATLKLAIGLVLVSLLTVGCGGGSSNERLATERITTPVSDPLDVFAKSMLNLAADTNNFLIDLDTTTFSSVAEIERVVAVEQSFVDRFTMLCSDARAGRDGASGDEREIWQAGLDWCTQIRDVWVRVVEIMRAALAGNPPSDADSPANNALFEASQKSGDRFSSLYCKSGGVLCGSRGD